MRRIRLFALRVPRRVGQLWDLAQQLHLLNHHSITRRKGALAEGVTKKSSVQCTPISEQ